MRYNPTYNAEKHGEKYIILDWAGNVKTFNKKSSIKLFDDVLTADDYLDNQVYKMSKSKDEQEKLREELKTVLDELTYSKLMETDAATVESVNKIQERT